MADLMRWNPFREMVSLRDAMDRLFEESFVRPLSGWLWQGNGMQTLALDVHETDENLVVEASLPGIRPDEVDVSVTANTLTIKGEIKHDEEQEKQMRYHVRERYYGPFQRTIILPSTVEASKADARFDNGVLRLVLPKIEEAKPKRIAVKAR